MNKRFLTIGECPAYHGLSFRSRAASPSSRAPSSSASDYSDDEMMHYQKPISKHCSRKMRKKRTGSDGGYDSAYKLIQKFKEDEVKRVQRLKEAEEQRQKELEIANLKLHGTKFPDACKINPSYGVSFTSTRSRGQQVRTTPQQPRQGSRTQNGKASKTVSPNSQPAVQDDELFINVSVPSRQPNEYGIISEN